MLRLTGLALLALALCACPGDKKTDAGSGGGGAGGGGASGGGTGTGGGGTGGGTGGGMHDAGTPDAGFKGVTVDDWCQDLAIVSCNREERCGALTAAHFDQCLLRYLQSCDQSAYSRGVHEGRIQFLSPKADDCLNAYASGSCTATPAACAQVFAGMVEPDGGCLIAEDCDSNTGFCLTSNFQCPHRCIGFVPRGGSCNSYDQQCASDSACYNPDGGDYERKCLAPVNDGLPCFGFWNPCQPGSTCGWDYSNPGVCVKQVAATGETCLSNNYWPACDSDDFCRQDLDTMPPPPGVCQRKGGLGTLCNNSYYACLPTLRCSASFQTGTCEPKGDLGDKCSNYGDCQGGMYCQPSTSTCQFLPGDGGDCGSTGSYAQCQLGYYCDFNGASTQWRCWPKQALGAECGYDPSRCLSNDCEGMTLPDGGYGGVCVPSCSQRADGGL